MVKTGLGRGLSSLIPQEDAATVLGAVEGEGSTGPQTVPTGQVRANPDQPRRTFNRETLEELADSVRRHGIIQPILVEQDGPSSYVIVAGERRYRAAVIAGLREVPVIVRSFTEEKRLEIAIIENVQREDLNPVEEAMGYKALMDLTGVTQEDLASRVGKNRSTVANALRILKLPEDVLDSVKRGDISSGHARALLSAVNPADMRVLFARIVSEGLSVRETEQTVQEFNRGARAKTVAKPAQKAGAKVPEVETIERKLIDVLGTKVTVSGAGRKGSVTIEYYSPEDLDRIYEIISGTRP